MDKRKESERQKVSPDADKGTIFTYQDAEASVRKGRAVARRLLRDLEAKLDEKDALNSN